jgi:hypothetical protein
MFEGRHNSGNCLRNQHAGVSSSTASPARSTPSMRAGKSASSEGVAQIRERGRPRFGQRTGRSCLGAQLQMGEYLLNHFGIFDAGNDLHGTATVLAGGDMPQGTFS